MPSSDDAAHAQNALSAATFRLMSMHGRINDMRQHTTVLKDTSLDFKVSLYQLFMD